MKRLIGCLTSCIALFAAGSASASIDCDYTVNRIFEGASGQIYAVLSTGNIYIDPTVAEPVKEKFFSMLLTAKTSNLHVTVRFTTSTSCSGEHSDVEGVWLG